ncbi:hypothetical protein WOLCODRAFT_73360 [Wolfiporia cocos MD-104 SS10]|uniref:Uncharacterized protein n=1 Tax=Wolfiporia cocos (strain MD-104) TaxID=742152 RepID=A0A2H3K1D7_WOLCO|nr:hypothetical protein WOLCODRAFT_73360 [Wolfiporia cocos MD-104 SS10]
MLPYFSNPHGLKESVQPVTRASLYADDDEDSGQHKERNADQDGMLSELEQLLKRSLGEVYTDMNSMNESEESSRTKKRRRAEINDTAQEASLPESMPFRLISNKLPPKAVHIEAKPPPAIIAKEPECEDNTEEARRRQSQAQEVAVDFEWLINESKKSYPVRGFSPLARLIEFADLPTPHPPLLITEFAKPPPEPPTFAKCPPHTVPSPHYLSIADIQCPIIDMAPSPSNSSHASALTKKRRRRNPRKAHERPPPAFWRPLREWGSKAAGYAMGYGGSWPVYKDDPLRYRYQRDTMRKGVIVA